MSNLVSLYRDDDAAIENVRCVIVIVVAPLARP